MDLTHSATSKTRQIISRRATRVNTPVVVPQLRSTLTIAEFKSAIADWLLDGEARLSPKTVLDRRLLLEKLTWWLEWQKCKQVGRTELARFFAYLPTAHTLPGGRWGTADNPNTSPKSKEPLQPRSCGNYFRWIATFFVYLIELGILDESPMKSLKPARHSEDQPDPFSIEEAMVLLDAARASDQPKRNVAILMLLLDTGARVGEIVGLKMQDFNTRERSIRVTGKGRKERTLYFEPPTLQAMNQYLRLRPRKEDEPLFMSRVGKEMTTSGVLQIFYRLQDAAGMSNRRVSPHICRHTFAVEFIRRGGDPISLQNMYGHTDIGTTRKYVALGGADMKRNHARFSLVSSLKPARKKP